MKLGLALSGGGARAVAHLGIIKYLEESGVRFDHISGSSAGALIGALYAHGMKTEEILEALTKTNFLLLFRPALNWRALLRIENGYNELKKYLPEDSFSALKTPLVVAATELKKGKVKYFKKGQLIMPILASCAIPIVFNPVKIKSKIYVDGGIRDNLPVKPLLKKCDVVVGLNCNPVSDHYAPGDWRDVIERSMLLSIDTATQYNGGQCDLFLEPSELSGFTVFDFKKMQDIYDIGYNHARQHQDSIMDLIENKVYA